MFEHDKQDFLLPVPTSTVARFLVHAELLKMAPFGHVVDIGVGSGGSTFAFAHMLRAMNRPGTVFGFDTFSGFPHVAPQDGNGHYVRVGGMSFGCEPITAAQRAPYLPIHFVVGDITQTVPLWARTWASGFCDFRITLLNLDADLYEPTKVALEYLMPFVAPGGIVILDDYDVPDFPGEKRAVDEYFQKRGGTPPVLHKHPWHYNPSRYFIV